MEPKERRNQLADLRGEVTRINASMLGLLNRRTELVDQILDVKRAQGLPLFDPQRESEQLEELISGNPGPSTGVDVTRVFREIFRVSLSRMESRLNQDGRQAVVQRAAAVEVKGIRIGDGTPVLMAGPCAIESHRSLFEVAQGLASLGVRVLRGGAFKPRTSPHAFQGLGLPGLSMIRDVASQLGMVTISEITDVRHLDDFLERVDILQVGARNMFNFDLLGQLAVCGKPVLLKRSFGARVDEWLDAAEYLLAGGNRQVILCERGIRTFETASRSTLDLSAVALVKATTHLPVIVDVSHAAGRKDLLIPLAKASLAAGADGLMVEVHAHPATALCDSIQQMDLEEFRLFHQALEPWMKERS